MILMYNLPLSSELRAAMALHKAEPRPVLPSEYGLPLSVLASGQPVTDVLPSAGVIEEPMLVFCGMSNQEVSDFLDLIRRLGVSPIALKAVLTPTTRNWTSAQLYQELKKEHEYFQNR